MTSSSDAVGGHGTAQKGHVDASLVQAMRADAVAGLVIGELSSQGIDSILLKGSALGELYPERPRLYIDADVLVHSARVPAVNVILRQLGFTELLPGVREVERVLHATTWTHPDLPDVDLHTTIWGSGLDDEATYEVLARHTELFTVAGSPCRRLNAPGRAFHLATHAAQSGAGRVAPTEDLLRGLLVYDEDMWRAATHLARELDALGPFAAGLRLFPTGAAVAERLGVADVAGSIEVELRVVNAARGAVSLARLGAQPSLRAKVAYTWSRLFPSPTLLRWEEPLARRGRLWLPVAYVSRLKDLGRTLPGAVRAYRRARVGASHRGSGARSRSVDGPGP